MRKIYSSEFKARLVLEVLRGERTLSEIASENQVHPNMLTRWKTEAVKNFSQLFEKEASKTKQPEPANTIYPYLLKNLVIMYPDQVWSIDITYVPIHKSWLYLVAIIDWYSRFVVDWEIDDNLEIYFVLEACKNALKKSAPEIINSDQGSHFTSPKYTNLFLESDSRISMDHRGRAYDNIFIERLWRSVKYENIYLQDYQNPREARIGINGYLKYYNYKRPHQSLSYKTPAEIYNK
ncbi:hypothetical protein CLOSBL3_11838 [Clostridiaceae bacterium BL-3]|nr:hypothetical protein CLOSBL3_11826 [Clostridiaceae bacterium BL-3]CAB1249165.1 hypothetical protein CLOSBL3_11838 [Clostridiaceae bacterium BL-3]